MLCLILLVVMCFTWWQVYGSRLAVCGWRWWHLHCWVGVMLVFNSASCYDVFTWWQLYGSRLVVCGWRWWHPHCWSSGVLPVPPAAIYTPTVTNRKKIMLGRTIVNFNPSGTQSCCDVNVNDVSNAVRSKHCTSVKISITNWSYYSQQFLISFWCVISIIFILHC